MTAKSGPIKRPSFAANISWPRRAVYFSTVLISVLGFSCKVSERRTMPPEVESAIASVGDDIAAERYEKIYNESSELWTQAATLEESVERFKTLRTKLGPVEDRTLQSATEQENSGGALKGRAFIVTYRTKFENAEGMETFTLVERNGKWLLARYFVNSTALGESGGRRQEQAAGIRVRVRRGVTVLPPAPASFIRIL